MRIVSIQIGRPKVYQDARVASGYWETATFKERVSGPIHLTKLGLEGDGHADLVSHGGPDKAVLFYAASHYPLWQRELGIAEFTNGALGENLTVDGATEADVCIGDRYSIGDAIVEVSQPRQPCWKQAMRWNRKDMVVLVNQAGRSGWYVRVHREGTLEEGMEVQLLERPYPEWSIERANRLFHFDKQNVAELRVLSEVPALANSWKNALRERL